MQRLVFRVLMAGGSRPRRRLAIRPRARKHLASRKLIDRHSCKSGSSVLRWTLNSLLQNVMKQYRSSTVNTEKETSGRKEGRKRNKER